MTITVNTNIASLVAQKSLNSATSKMNTAMERMTTGYRINSSADDAAGMAVSTKLRTQLQTMAVAEDNTQLGMSLLETSEGVLDVMQSSLQRIRDLTEQAANGTYGSDSLKGLIVEIQGRLDEITRVSNTVEFNGIKLLDGTTKSISLQVGTGNTVDDVIKLDSSLFQSADSSALLTLAADGTQTICHYRDQAGDEQSVVFDVKDIASLFEPHVVGTSDATASDMARGFLSNIDSAIADLTEKKATIGCTNQRLLATQETLIVQQQTYTESNSRIQDADVAVESSNYIKYQILQQVTSSLLVSANQAPSIAVDLV